MDVRVKGEGVIAGAQGFRKVRVQSQILCRKYISTGYRQENIRKAQADVKMAWDKYGFWKKVATRRDYCIGRVLPVQLQ